MKTNEAVFPVDSDKTNKKKKKKKKKTTTTSTTTTIIPEGADPLRPAWGHPTEGRSSRASPEYV